MKNLNYCSVKNIIWSDAHKTITLAESRFQAHHLLNITRSNQSTTLAGAEMHGTLPGC